MPPPQLHLLERPATRLRPIDTLFAPRPQRDLGHVLRTMGVITGEQLLFSRQKSAHCGIELGRYLHLNGLVSSSSLVSARARATGLGRADILGERPDPRLIDRLGASRCLRDRVLPWKSVGGAILVALSDPADLEGVDLGPEPLIPVLAEEGDIRAAILSCRSRQLARRAEVRTDEDVSCRNWPIKEIRRVTTLGALACLLWAWLAPAGFLATLLGWSILTMFALVGFKLTAAILYLARGPVREADPEGKSIPLARQPEVSVIVPLFREKEIAARLVQRLTRLTYPKELLEICLVLEAGDVQTKRAIARTDLPPWFKVVEVPPGRIMTKPRALNFALDFCRGQIIGVYDAEDAPEPDQISKIVARFQRRGPEVASLQARLDYYNPRQNWLSRCFAIEYATWFRVLLPGMQRIGWPIPLGGTSVFFRRSALEVLGAWDAHNVTEDADLGLRLARNGLKTELVATATFEEANCRLWPWIKQRSRWLKGYAVTYAVHMRSPRSLWRDLGPWKFLGMQVLFLGTLSQFILAPLLWSFWPALFGLWHPFQGVIGATALWAIMLTFITAEVVSIAVSALAVSTREKRFLIAWIPTMIGYFPFATVSALKGLWELRSRPFYWDKTEHGVGGAQDR